MAVSGLETKGLGKTMKSKFQKEIIEEFLRWSVIRLDTDRVGGQGKKTRDKANERLLALKLICKDAGLEDALEKIQDGRNL